MSIYVFITRKPLPFEPDGPKIHESEWLEASSREQHFRTEPGGSGSLLWAPDGLDPVLFELADGQVQVKNSSPEVIACMLRLARSLGARVVSETGEIFGTEGKHAGFEKWSEFYKPEQRSLLSRLFGKNGGDA